MDVFYGKIEFDGKIYKSIDPRDSYFTLISKKFKGEQSYPQFIDEGFRGSAMDAEKLIIIREKNLFKEIVFLHELPKRVHLQISISVLRKRLMKQISLIINSPLRSERTSLHHLQTRGECCTRSI